MSQHDHAIKTRPAESRIGDWFQTYEGIQFWSMDPRVEDISINDIAHSLSLLCRFNGHTKVFYSVAQHSVLVHHIFGKLIKNAESETNSKAFLCALLHDATEAYVGDLIRPIKRSIPEFKNMENRIWDCILEKYNLREEWSYDVANWTKQADTIALATERRDLLEDGPGRNKYKWDIDERADPDPVTIIPQPPTHAEHVFLMLFDYLTGLDNE